MPELHHGVGLVGRPVRIGEADRFHRPVTEGFAARRSAINLDRQAAFEIGCPLPVMEGGLLAAEHRIDQGLILLAVERAIEIVTASTTGAGLVVSGTETRRYRG